MKTKCLIFFVFISFIAVAQKVNKTPLYTFCGKPGVGTLTFKGSELKECKKELVPLLAEDKIKSFSVSMNVSGSSVSFIVNGNHNDQLNEMINNSCGGKTNQKIIIEKVQIIRGDKIVKAPGVVIEIVNTN